MKDSIAVGKKIKYYVYTVIQLTYTVSYDTSWKNVRVWPIPFYSFMSVKREMKEYWNYMGFC